MHLLLKYLIIPVSIATLLSLGKHLLNSMDLMSVTSALVAVVSVAFIYSVWRNRRPASFPPGPTHIPFIGNLLSLTDEPLAKQFIRWKEIYGPIFSFSFGNT